MRRIPKGWETMRLADTIARSARLHARKEDRPCTREDLEDVMNGWQSKLPARYALLRWPALRTLITVAKRQSKNTDDRLDF